MKALGFSVEDGGFRIPIKEYDENGIGILGGINYAGEYYILAIDVNWNLYACNSTRKNIITLFKNIDK